MLYRWLKRPEVHFMETTTASGDRAIRGGGDDEEYDVTLPQLALEFKPWRP